MAETIKHRRIGRAPPSVGKTDCTDLLKAVKQRNQTAQALAAYKKKFFFFFFKIFF